MEEMPSLNMPDQRLKVAILPLDIPCSGPVTHSGEILTNVKFTDFWIRETGTVQQVAQLHERYDDDDDNVLNAAAGRGDTLRAQTNFN